MSSRTPGSLVFVEPFVGNSVKLLGILDQGFHHESFSEQVVQVLIRCTGADPGFGQGGAPASEAESCRCSEAELPE